MFMETNERIITGKRIKEGSVYFIRFMDNRMEKWCHARIDKIETDSITFRTAANAEPIRILDSDILEIEGNANKMNFDEITMKALYRGEIITTHN